MMEDNIIYGGSVSYRNMCRYNSGVRCDYPWIVRLIQYSFSTVLLQTSFIGEIQVVLAYRVRKLYFFPNFFFYLLFIFPPFRPHVHFHCDILYDPFLFMEENKKIYCMLFLLLSSRSFKSKIFYSFYNYDVRIFSYDPNSMESCHGFVLLFSKVK